MAWERSWPPTRDGTRVAVGACGPDPSGGLNRWRPLGLLAPCSFDLVESVGVLRDSGVSVTQGSIRPTRLDLPSGVQIGPPPPPRGRRSLELADGPHCLERAADWQAGLLGARKSRRPARLRASEEAGARSSKAPLIQPRRSLVSRDLMGEG